LGSRDLVNGAVALAAGFLASSVSSFLGHIAILGTRSDFVEGFLDGLSAVAFAVAIFFLVRGRRLKQP
jgi:hypothetical protein